MKITLKPKLNAYINSRNNQIFYMSFPFSGDASLNIYTIGMTLPSPKYQININMNNPDGCFYHFEYVTEGKGSVLFDNETFELKKGDLLFVAKNCSYEISSSKHAPLKKYFISANGVFLDGILSSHNISSPFIIVQADVEGFFRKIADTFSGTEEFSATLSNIVEVELLKIIQQLDIAFSNKNSTHLTRAENILGYIEQHLTEDISIEKISAVFFISKSHLMRIFKEKYKITPMKYMMSRKISLAKYYLKQTDLSVSEIATLLSFSDRKYFSKVFKKHTKTTPVNFRKSDYS